ncbi:MAG: IgGFc-binding protein [bacterium]
MQNLRILILVILLFPFVWLDASAQSDNRGKDFWVCFPQNAKYESAGLRFRLYITSEFSSKGSVTISGLGFVKKFQLAPNAIATIDLDTSCQIVGSNAVVPFGVHVVSDNPVAVYGLSNRKASTDSYVAYPTNVLGTEYRVLGYHSLGDDAFTTQATIVASEDNTEVSISLTGNVKMGKHNGESYSIHLNKGDAYQMQGTSGTDGKNDLTGTLVTSNNPIAFFTGHTCAEVPPPVEFCDMLLEQEPPINTWGKQFFLSKMTGKADYALRVLANENDTKVFLNNAQVAILNPGAYYENNRVSDNAVVTTDKPVLVAQYARSANADSVKIGDPFMTLIAPTEQFLSAYTFVTPIKDDPSSKSVSIFQQDIADPSTHHVVISDSLGISHLFIQKNLVDTAKLIHSFMISKFRKDAIAHARAGEHKAFKFVKNSEGQIFEFEAEAEDTNPEVSNFSRGGWQHFINIIIPTNSIQSIRLDSFSIPANKFTAVGLTTYSIAQVEIPYGSHSISADRPFGLYSYGFGLGGENFDSYGNIAGQRVMRIARNADTSKPTLEIAPSTSADQINLIARDDRIDDLGIGKISVTDSSHKANPVTFPTFEVGAPQVTFSVAKPTQANCVYLKIQDFAKNTTYYALCPTSGGNNSDSYSLQPMLVEQSSEHSAYPVSIYPVPATFGQPIRIAFTNNIPEIVSAIVLDEEGQIVTELQRKQMTQPGNHWLVYHSEKFSTGSYFLRLTAYSLDGSTSYQQDARFIVIH